MIKRDDGKILEERQGADDYYYFALIFFLLLYYYLKNIIEKPPLFSDNALSFLSLGSFFIVYIPVNVLKRLHDLTPKKFICKKIKIY